MEASFFGPAGKELFGVYYEPERPVSSRTSPLDAARGVILCNPMLGELSLSCKCYHHLATLLAEAGIAAFRFHYYATGDSAGADEEGSVSQWLADIGCAAAELRGRGCEQLCLAGLRFGATLAALFAKQHGLQQAIDSLILWEPCVSGQDCLRDLVRQHALMFKNPNYALSPRKPEMLGHAFPDRLEAEIGPVRLDESFEGCRRVLLIEHDPPRFCESGGELRLDRAAESRGELRLDGDSLRPQLEKSPCPFDYESTDGPRFWETTLGLSHVPRPLLQRMVAWVAAGTAGSAATVAGRVSQ